MADASRKVNPESFAPVRGMRTRVVGRGSTEIMANAAWDEVVEPKVSGVLPEGSKTSTGVVLQNPTPSAQSAPLSVPSPSSPKELSPQE